MKPYQGDRATFCDDCIPGSIVMFDQTEALYVRVRGPEMYLLLTSSVCLCQQRSFLKLTSNLNS